jgi:hypothetical protein
MGTLNKQIEKFCATAYNVLKDEISDKACWTESGRDREKYLDFIMLKSHYYYGKWVVFEGAVFLMTVDENLLKEWLEKYSPPSKKETEPKTT